MWERVIIHSDINHCYAQIEEMMFPELRKVPMVVGGNEKSRHGIVLAKNDLAKKYHLTLICAARRDRMKVFTK